MDPAPVLSLGVAMPSESERADMLTGVEKLIVSLAGKAGGTREEKEDRGQELRLLAWKLTEQFDPARGCKFSTYFATAANRLIERERVRKANRPQVLNDRPDGFNSFADPRSLADPDPEPADLADDLAEAVRRQMTRGFLDKLPPGFRSIVAAVVEDGLTAGQIAEQRGIPAKSVRANLKLAIRMLAARGLTQHVASEAAVAITTGRTDGRDVEQCREESRRSRQRASERQLPGKLADIAAKPGYAVRLAKLAPDTAALVELIRADRLTVGGAADLLGTDPAAVWGEVKAAMQKLRPPVPRKPAAVAV